MNRFCRIRRYAASVLFCVGIMSTVATDAADVVTSKTPDSNEVVTLPYFDAETIDEPFEHFDRHVKPAAAMMQPPVLGDMEFSTSGPEVRGDAETYPHIFSTDVRNPNRFWYTERANILQRRVPDNWDAMKLINTDRPDFTDVATVVGKGVTQWETGYFWDRREDGFVRREKQFGPNALVRLGMSDHFEWRIKWLGGFGQSTIDHATGIEGWQGGYSDVELGFKRILIEQNDWVPLQTIVTRLSVPMGSSRASANAVQPGLTYVYNWQVRRWWFFRGASGVDWLRDPLLDFDPNFPGVLTLHRDSYVQGHQSISSYVQICKKIGMFTEWFMFYRGQTVDTRPDHYHNYGLYLYATPNFQFDMRIGWRIGNRVDETFTACGVSWRY